MIYVFGALAVLAIVSALLAISAFQDDRDHQDRLEAMANGHRPPGWSYEGGFVETTRCQACGIVSYRSDQRPTRPCRLCGGVVGQHKVMRWDRERNRWGGRA